MVFRLNRLMNLFCQERLRHMILHHLCFIIENLKERFDKQQL